MPTNLDHEFQTVCCIILNKYNQCLILQRHEKDENGGYWDLPSGGREAGETELQSAKRELWEEAGVKDVDLSYLFSYVFSLNQNVYTSHVFFGEYDQEVNLSHEHQDYKWLSLHETLDKLLHSEQKEALKKFISQNFSAFTDKPEKINFDQEFGERGIAVIKINETGEFVVYDKNQRNDLRIRFPGGHIDPGENGLEAAIRETWEEVGIRDLKLVKYLGCSHGFYNLAKDPEKIIHKLDHYYQFEISLEQWTTRKTDQKDEIGCFLADINYLSDHSTSQILDTLSRLI